MRILAIVLLVVGHEQLTLLEYDIVIELAIGVITLVLLQYLVAVHLLQKDHALLLQRFIIANCLGGILKGRHTLAHVSSL